jgi:hypothetical protein
MRVATRIADASQVQTSRAPFEQLATGLGWFSVGLGVGEVAAPGAIANLIGLRNGSRRHILLRSPLCSRSPAPVYSGQSE